MIINQPSKKIIKKIYNYIYEKDVISTLKLVRELNIDIITVRSALNILISEDKIEYISSKQPQLPRVIPTRTIRKLAKTLKPNSFTVFDAFPTATPITTSISVGTSNQLPITPRTIPVRVPEEVNHHVRRAIQKIHLRQKKVVQKQQKEKWKSVLR
jgi:hypothetical protein